MLDEYSIEQRATQIFDARSNLRIADVPLNVPVRTGWEWILLDVSG